MKKIFSVLAVLLVFPSVTVYASKAEDISVSARSAILINADTCEIIYEKNSGEQLPMASTTKIMTCIVAIENAPSDNTVRITPSSAGTEGTSLYMKVGDTISFDDLLYGLMLQSANDAASAIAVHVAGNEAEFVEMMNGKAIKLGLSKTHFTNPHGLPDEGHYTTARDLAVLTSYALKNEKFSEIVSSRTKDIVLNGSENRKLRNHNRLLFSYEGANGVKTGFTKKAGRCLVSSAERNGVNLIAVTLNAGDDWNDHRKMLDYGFSEYSHKTLIEKGQIKKELRVFGEGCVCASNADSFEATVKNGAVTEYVIIADRLLSLPIEKGERVAYAEVYSDKKLLGTLPLFSESTMPYPKDQSLFEKFTNLFR